MITSKQAYVLKNGYIVDGNNTKGYLGNLLIEDGSIKKISKEDISTTATVIDCTGKVISPGFIDIHSHNDWFFASSNVDDFIAPFTKQGITTFLGGNCGFSAAGLKKESKSWVCTNLYERV